jgi:hypothetical protein
MKSARFGEENPRFGTKHEESTLDQMKAKRQAYWDKTKEEREKKKLVAEREKKLKANQDKCNTLAFLRQIELMYQFGKLPKKPMSDETKAKIAEGMRKVRAKQKHSI